jgi:hypothetical protein
MRLIRLFEPDDRCPPIEWAPILADVGVGFMAGVVTFLLAMFTGGFVFFAPWIFWSVVVLFLAGLARGARSTFDTWVQAACINLTWFIIVLLWLQGQGVLIWAAATILC